MPKRTTDFRDDLLVDLADPQEAAHYLNAALEDSEELFLIALRDVAEARQMVRVAESAGVARESIYRMLTVNGNPTYSSLLGILRAVGLKLAIEPGGIETPQPVLPEPSASTPAGSVMQTEGGRANSAREKGHLTAASCFGRKGILMKNPPHPGRIVRQDCLLPLGLTVMVGARILGVTRQALNNLVNGKSGVSPEMAVRLAKAFGSDAETWLRMQLNYDLAQVRKDEIQVKRYKRAS
jgi:addiction module HigA family antidote